MSLDPYLFLNTFREEAGEHLIALEEGLLVLERYPEDEETLRHLLQVAHSLKGSTAMLNMQSLAQLVHALEDTLALARTTPPSPEQLKRMFAALDLLQTLIPESLPGENDDARILPMIATLQHRAPHEATQPEASQPNDQHNLVWLVEPSPSARQVVSWALEDAGYTVISSTSVPANISLAVIAETSCTISLRDILNCPLILLSTNPSELHNSTNQKWNAICLPYPVFEEPHSEFTQFLESYL